jgi:hypothetical protein
LEKLQYFIQQQNWKLHKNNIDKHEALFRHLNFMKLNENSPADTTESVLN